MNDAGGIFQYTQHFWLLFVVVSCINCVYLYAASRKLSREHPEYEESNRRFVTGIVLWLNLPWLVMGLGSEYGGVPSIFDFLTPRSGDPWVLAWWGTVILSQAVYAWWIFVGDGAKVLSRFQSIRRRTSLSISASPRALKIQTLLMLLGSWIAMTVMATLPPGSATP